MKIAVVGAGRMGGAVVFDLAQRDEVEKILVADVKIEAAQRVVGTYVPERGEAIKLDASGEEHLGRVFEGYDVVISAAPYRFNFYLAKAAMAGKCHFCDMGGNNAVVEQELGLNDIAKEASVSIVPDCGLAPGLVNILAAGLIDKLDEIFEVRLRVGGLPQHPEPPLNYSLSFSVYGLINEYNELCRVIEDYEVTDAEPLTGLEKIEFDGFPELEAFHTSGGSSTLPITYQDRVKELDYKTIRYRGHCEQMSLLRYLGFFSQERNNSVGCSYSVPRDCLASALTRKLGSTDEDVILLRATAKGIKDGKDKVITYEMVDYPDRENDITAMMRCTAYPVSITALWMGRGETDPGALTPEKTVPCDKMISELARRGVIINEK